MTTPSPAAGIKPLFGLPPRSDLIALQTQVFQATRPTPRPVGV